MVRPTAPGDPGVMYEQPTIHGRGTRGQIAKLLARRARPCGIPLGIMAAGLVLTRVSPGIGWGLIVSGLAALARAAPYPRRV